MQSKPEAENAHLQSKSCALSETNTFQKGRLNFERKWSRFLVCVALSQVSPQLCFLVDVCMKTGVLYANDGCPCKSASDQSKRKNVFGAAPSDISQRQPANSSNHSGKTDFSFMTCRCPGVSERPRDPCD